MRIIPLIFALFIIAPLDRNNIGRYVRCGIYDQWKCGINPRIQAAKIALVPLHVGAKLQLRFLDPDPRLKQARERTDVRFTPDGKAVVYAIRENGTDNLWVQPLDGSPGRQITSFPENVIQAFQYSLDSKTLGVMSTSFESDIVLLHDLEPTSQ
jgi:hypothetical protein